MSKLLNIIPPQPFELIRNRIADILIDEISNQVVMSYDTEIDVDVYIERSVPFDTTELPAINISLARGNFDNKNAPSTDGTYTYNIDCYTSAKSNDEDQGDSLSAVKLQKIIGICRYILDNPVYKTLGYQAPYINRVSCSEFNIASPGKDDALYSGMGRLTLTVVVNSKGELITPSLMNGYETSIKMGAENQGYYYLGGTE